MGIEFRSRGRYRALLWCSVAWISLGFSVAGAVLPVLPTTPFLLLAAWSASRGSPRLHQWLYQHPYIGSILHAWHTERAVPYRAKLVAILMMLMSWIILWLLDSSTAVLIFVTALFIMVSGYLLSLPSSSHSRM